MPIIRKLIASLASLSALTAQSVPTPPRLLADINPTPRRVESSFVEHLTNAGAVTYFTADDGLHGRELWSTLGNSATTRLVHDLFPGATGSSPQFLQPIRTPHGYELFFLATSATHGLLPYVTAGTTGSPPVVLDPAPGAHPWHTIGSLAIDDKVLFLADDGVHGHEVWVTDGTPAGTFMLPEFYAGIEGFNFILSPLLFERRDQNGAYAVIAVPSVSSLALWRTDGTIAGTTQITSIAWSGTHSLGRHCTLPGGPSLITLSIGSTAPGGFVLYATDGTAAGTHLVQPIANGTNYDVSPMTFAGRAWFGGNAGIFAISSDGTASGTTFHGVSGPTPGSVSRFCGTHGGSLWCIGSRLNGLIRFDPGNPTGTPIPISGATVTGRTRSLEDAFVVGNSILYLDSEQSNAVAIDIPSRTASILRESQYRLGYDNRVMRGGLAILPLGSSIHPSGWEVGYELFASDGTQAGTTLVANINDEANHPPNDRSYASGFSRVAGSAMFGAYSPSSPYADSLQIWQSDGTSAHTGVLLQGWYPYSERRMAEASNGMYFYARVPAGNGIAFSDGTSSGTRLIPYSRPTAPGVIDRIEMLGDLALYATFESPGIVVWRSDPNSTDPLPIPQLPFARYADIACIGERAVIFATTLSSSPTLHTDGEISSTDGTAAGSRVVTTFQAPYPSNLARREPFAAFADRIWFRAFSPGTQTGVLWQSDGTIAGTRPFTTPTSGPRGSVDVLVPAGDILYVIAGGQLWTTDGTAPLTRIATLFLTGESIATATMGDRLLVRTSQGELWVSDGTNAGTRRLHSFAAIPNVVTEIVSAGARHAFFTAVPAGGTALDSELWITDGTVAGTHPFSTLRAIEVTLGRLIHGMVYLTLEDPIAGSEPHVVDPGASVEVLTPGCGGTRAPDLVALDDPVLGTAMRLRGRSSAGSFGVLMLSLARSGPNPTLPGTPCRFAVDLASFATTTPFALTSNRFQLNLPIPPDPNVRGLQVAVQCALGPTNATVRFDLTNGLLLTLGY